MRLTAKHVAKVERVEPDPGPEDGTVEHTDEDFQRLAIELLAEYQPKQLWIFAYGSLIWNPEFDAISSVKAKAHGWHRSFCLSLTRWRGTREVPGLMLALDRGGSCVGVAYLLPDADHVGQIVRLLEREIDANPPTNVPRWITIVTPTGRQKALAIVASRAGPAYAGNLPLPVVANTLARAAGHWGSAAQYLFRTVTMLESHGIHDWSLERLQHLVALEIESLDDCSYNRP